MQRYQAIIIDDEKNIREALSIMLSENCPQIRVCGTGSSAEEGRKLLSQHSIDLIFLDISMPWEDGFDFLNSINRERYGIIFITAFEEYALMALKANAIDYLLKPVNPNELKEAVQKAIRLLELRQDNTECQDTYNESLTALSRMAAEYPPRADKFTVSEQDELHRISISELMYLQADGNYSIIHLSGLKKVVSAVSIDEFQKMLDGTLFFRIHKSTLINLGYLSAYTTGENCHIALTDGTRLSISRSKLAEFEQAVTHYSKNRR